MVDSSDFETDVGTMDVYARGADPVYVTAPSSSQQEEGVKPLDRLPAQWWNWFLHEATNRFSNYKSYISNALAELDNLLDLSAITPDDTKTNQLKGMFENDYLQKYLPEVVSDSSTFAVDATKESSILVSNDDGNNGFDIKKVPYAPCFIYNAQSITAVKTIALPANSPYDGQCFKVVFKNGHNCANSSTPMTLNGKPVLVNVNGTLSALPIHTMTEGGGTVYKSLQANTVLDIYYDANYDGNNNDAFVIIGNPVVLSAADYTIYADGLNVKSPIDSVVGGNMHPVTSNAVNAYSTHAWAGPVETTPNTTYCSEANCRIVINLTTWFMEGNANIGYSIPAGVTAFTIPNVFANENDRIGGAVGIAYSYTNNTGVIIAKAGCRIVSDKIEVSFNFSTMGGPIVGNVFYSIIGVRY